ncbi:MAG TPA: class I SAM-dependent methyltransferase, partial [Roseiflexaceae bacterium]|nr:class I SAM-dependent methyltransferase [Roseiflexaceae bacterium]
FYDTARSGVTAVDEQTLLPHLRAMVEGMAAPKVLDVATGTGRVPLLLAGQPWFGGQVCGIDIAPAMLAQAQAKIASAGVGNHVALREGDANALPWAEGMFDVVTSLEALEFFPRPRRALAEMARVLRPGGGLLVSKYPDVWARTLPLKGLTKSSMKRALERLGFDAIEFCDWQPGHYELVIAWKIADCRL